ncbi:hypothetical protein HELRODRAFT_164652 [Helobdella robusta]|uniref:Bis(5'-nucleosyl)-tetraphosphatase [asymmetrical] n=1 Tax=Helobdella robusta TaxID=6412 RepID=T1EVP2_HELRO|nr:hypothetical protein HELRODRAFT_164652 [Helobdella robusta]ESN92579.1 hypothetical protein HELRODRAFT_164652 [Helobdella robusta]
MLIKAAGLIVYRFSNVSSKKAIEFLLLKASYGNHHWSPPKGIVNDKEDLIETAVRETKEETGLDKQYLKIFYDKLPIISEYKINGKPKTVYYWVAKLLAHKEIILSKEHVKYKWCDCSEAYNLVGHEEMKVALKTASTIISQSS